MANHPLGGIDFFALAHLLDSVRPGAWKFFSNQILTALPVFRDHLLSIDVLGRSPAAHSLNRRGLADAIRCLRSGGIIGLFPAGRVAHRHRDLGGALADRAWSEHAVRLAAKTGAAVACLHISGQNSPFFLRLPPTWPRLRALMLCREFTRPVVTKIQLQLAFLGKVEDMGVPLPQATAWLHARCHLQADLADAARPQPGLEKPQSPVSLPPTNNLPGELKRDPAAHLASHGSFDLFFLAGREVPETLQALGRAREHTFRTAGQGTGQAVDLAPEDTHYHHLILWDRKGQQLAGAYRVGLVSEILAKKGAGGLYLHHVFHLRPALFRAMGETLELSRSFVLPAYQRESDALAALWKGLGAVATARKAKTFFGSVTISNAHHPASRAILVDHLRRNYGDDPTLCRLVRPRRPLIPPSHYHSLFSDAYAGQPVAALAPLIDEIEQGKRGIPPLIRYYCGIGAKFLGFHVEAAFQDALYCLLRVDIPSIPPAYRRRFMPRG
ncbi:MAG: lysophospholipid acyltransferase family protein [Opitutales bacterium]|nr:lysophospholipid acyltransferase family protein [Opitutales bacterium]